MSATPPEKMSDSWIDLSSSVTPPLSAAAATSAASPGRVTPVPFGGEQDYMRMLREAQRESYRSSARVSPISSAIMSLSTTPKKNSPSSTPKSPPNSPNPELAAFPEEMRGVYVNKLKRETNGGGGNANLASDIVWDWTSRPNIHPKEWKAAAAASSSSAVTRSRKSSESSKLSSGASGSWFSCTLIITNILSFLLGTGIGIWLCKRGAARGCGCLVRIAATL